MNSCLNELLFVVNLTVEVVEVLDQLGAFEWVEWLFEGSIGSLELQVELLPLLVQALSVFFVHLHGVHLLLCGVHLEGLVEGQWIDFLENGLESNERLLEDLVPVVISEVNNDGHKHWEGLLLVSLEDVQEVVVLEEAHGPVSNLEVDTANASHDSLEELVDKVLNLVNFANLKNLLELGEEQCFLDAVGKWPVLDETLEQWDGQSSILGKEEHGTSQELLVELGARLDLMERDNNILEE